MTHYLTRTERISMDRSQLTHKKRILAIRDGKECFFCGIEYPKDKLTIEHFVAVANGGNDHMSNLCLACPSCNKAVDKISVTKKVGYREKMRNDRM